MDLSGIAIESSNLLQIPINVDYACEIFREFDMETTKYMYPKPAANLAETQNFIHNSLVELQAGTNLQLVILLKTTGEFIGCSGLHHIGNVNPELGIWIKKSAHGHGFGMEAIDALIEWARASIKFDHLVYPVDKRNQPSRRIPQKHNGKIVREYKGLNQSGFELDQVEYWIY